MVLKRMLYYRHMNFEKAVKDKALTLEGGSTFPPISALLLLWAGWCCLPGFFQTGNINHGLCFNNALSCLNMASNRSLVVLETFGHKVAIFSEKYRAGR